MTRGRSDCRKSLARCKKFPTNSWKFSTTGKCPSPSFDSRGSESQWVAEFLHEEFQCHLYTLNIIKLNTWKLLEVFNQLPVVLQQVLLVKSLPRLWIRVNQPLSKCISVFFQLKLSSVSGCSCSSMPGQGPVIESLLLVTPWCVQLLPDLEVEHLLNLLVKPCCFGDFFIFTS